MRKFTSNNRAGKNHFVQDFTLNYPILPKFIKNYYIFRTPIVRAKRGGPSYAGIEVRKTLSTTTSTTPIRASKRSKKI